MRHADWKGKRERRFRFAVMGWRWGRWCYRTDATGATVERWFEYEPLSKGGE